jgi:hypothetical protein
MTDEVITVDPAVAEEVKAIAHERPSPFVRGYQPKRTARTDALLAGDTVFVPGDKPTRNWNAWYAKTMRPRGLRVRQLYAEFQGQTGHFVWAEPLAPEGSKRK